MTLPLQLRAVLTGFMLTLPLASLAQAPPQPLSTSQCYAWSKGQTGVDPMAAPATVRQPVRPSAS